MLQTALWRRGTVLELFVNVGISSWNQLLTCWPTAKSHGGTCHRRRCCCRHRLQSHSTTLERSTFMRALLHLSRLTFLAILSRRTLSVKAKACIRARLPAKSLRRCGLDRGLKRKVRGCHFDSELISVVERRLTRLRKLIVKLFVSLFLFVPPFPSERAFSPYQLQHPRRICTEVYVDGT